MLKNKKAGRIITQLKELAEGNISFHAQIVVCPGINDGLVLKNTILDLLNFSENLLSIAIVPVGLTKYSNPILHPVTKEIAENICLSVSDISDEDKEKTNLRRIFIADEFYIKAGIPIPDRSYYETYPQIENGVGLVRLLLEEWEKIKVQLREKRASSVTDTFPIGSMKRIHILLITSMSAQSYIYKIMSEFSEYFLTIDIQVVSVTNSFFGESVTVAGLLTGVDIIKTIKKTAMKWDVALVPQVIFNYKNITLDGFSLNRIEKYAGCPVKGVTDLTQLVNICKKYTYEK
jgi:NifB/MoaA-like Fe-S oxidoreductase